MKRLGYTVTEMIDMSTGVHWLEVTLRRSHIRMTASKSRAAAKKMTTRKVMASCDLFPRRTHNEA